MNQTEFELFKTIKNTPEGYLINLGPLEIQYNRFIDQITIYNKSSQVKWTPENSDFKLFEPEVRYLVNNKDGLPEMWSFGQIEQFIEAGRFRLQKPIQETNKEIIKLANQYINR